MDTSQLPLLPCWPPEVFPHEPAHAFFRRLAEVNGQVSARTLATTFGLNGRNIRPQDFVSFCESFPAANIDELAKASAMAEGAFATLGGEVFSTARDISFGHPRVCGACVAEQRYYRNWFDLAVITRCPFHGLPLIEEAGGMRLAWWYPPITMTPSGENLEARGIARITPLPASWERYVLGRIGVAEPLQVPLLDDQPMWQVIHIADVLGMSALEGWHKEEIGRFGKHDRRRGEALREGFNILNTGPSGIKAHLRDIARSGPYRTLGPRTGIHRLYGGLRAIVLRLPSFPLANDLRLYLEEAAKELGVVSRKGRPVGAHLDGVAYTLNEVAGMLRIKPARLRALALKLAVVEPLAGKYDRHWITPKGLETIQSTINDLVARQDAVSMTGLGMSEFKRRCEEAGVQPYIRYGAAGPSSDHFLKTDLSKLNQSS